MGTISNPRAIYGLLATGTHTKTNVANDAEVGNASTTITLTGATKAYTVSATLALGGDTLTIDTSTGIATIGTTPVAQVETATVVAASGATSNGNLAVTVTGARITGSPVAVSVALTTADNTASLVASKIRAALTANTAISSVYTVGGTGANVVLTETDPKTNDNTLNIAWAAGLGVSALTTSTNTTTGVGGVKLTNNTGDGKDFEGVSLGTMTNIFGVLAKPLNSSFSINLDSGDWVIEEIEQGGMFLWVNPIGRGSAGNLVIAAVGALCEVEVTIFAE